MKFKNDYLCDFGDCRVELPSDQMFYVKMPKGKVYSGKIKRFCSMGHLIESAKAEGFEFEVI